MSKEISIVIASRNDNYYGEKSLRRLSYCVASVHLALQGIDYEIILVDYNPPSGKKPLSFLFNDPHIRHVVVTNDEHSLLIKKHLDAGAKYITTDAQKEEFCPYDFPMFPHYAINYALRYVQGNYVLAFNTDEICPHGFNKIIPSLKPNIIYRCPRKHVDPEDIDSEFDAIMWGQRFKKSVDAKTLDKRTSNLWKAQGSFILMDKNSWLEIGGYLPIPHPRVLYNDGQVVFCGLVKKKPIYCLDYRIINIWSLPKIHRLAKDVNYVISKDGIEYNHFQEMQNAEWLKCKKWLKTCHFIPNKLYSLSFDGYLDRLRDIQFLFNSVMT